jgi:CBS domain-containing protein
LFEWKPRSLIPVACAATVAAALRVPLLGWGPLFPALPHAALDAKGLGLCLLTGVVAGFGSGALTSLVYAFEDLFSRLPIHWMWWPAIGGLIVGLGGLLQPRALGVGYDLIRELLAGHDAGGSLPALLLVKTLIWSVALGSGTSGGVLAPLLIIGGTVGALLSQWLHLPSSGVWAMMGMAAIMGGTMRSPLTAIIFALELTRDAAMLPGLLLATMAADAVTVLLMRRSILTEKVARRGHHVMREYVVSALQRLRVEEAMDHEVPTLPAKTRVAEIVRRFGEPGSPLARQHAWILVDDEFELAGLITRGDILKALSQGGAEKTLLEAGTTTVEAAYPDELVEDAVMRMAQRNIGRVPVVQRTSRRQLVGYFGRDAVMRTLLHRLEEEQIEHTGALFRRRQARVKAKREPT